MDKICEWDSEIGEQVTRDATTAEQAVIDAMRNAPVSNEVYNAPIFAALAEIDSKSIRALREGNQVRIDALESEAVVLRIQLRK